MKKLLIGIFAVASVITVTSCSKSNNTSTTPTAKANVMFVNGSAGTTPLNVSVNGAAITSGSNLVYLKGTGYVNVTSGNDTVSFLYNSTQTLFKDTIATLAAGYNYSVFAGGLINPSTMLITTDDLTAPSAGNAKIRVVNLSSDTAHVSMVIGINTLFSGIASNHASAFTEIAAGNSTIVVGSSTNAISVVQPVVAGKIYTVMYTGTLNGSSSVALAATVLNNN